MPSAVKLREDYSAEARFGDWLRGQRTSTRAGGFCPWLGSRTGWTEARRRRSGEWTGKRCATGSIASTPRVRTASSTTGRRVPSLAFRRSNWLSSHRSSRPALIVMSTASCAGGGSTSSKRHCREVRRRVSSALCRKSFCRSLASAHISARPRHPAQDERIVEAFKKTSHTR